MTRHPFVLYLPADAPEDQVRAWGDVVLGFAPALERRGHPVTCLRHDQKVDWSLPGLWIMLGSVSDRERINRSGQAVAGGAYDWSDQPNWPRVASCWIAAVFDYFPGIVESEFAGHTYRHRNHFVFGHLGEEESRREWLQLKPDEVFLDVGACLGSWTLPAAACGARVFSFEPGTDAAFLSAHVAMNRLPGKVRIIPELVGDTAGQLVERESIPWHSIQSKQVLGPAMTTTIDTLVRDASLERVDLIKIDVDGGEEAALAGAERTIADYRPRLVIEVHDFLGIQTGTIADIMSRHGYKVTVVPKEEGFYHHAYCEPTS